MIFGFEEIESNILKLFKDNKLHHCNLIYGSEGIGKSTFITENIAPVILDVENIEKTKKLILSGGHTDFIKLDINSLTEDGKENTSKKNEINVSQARRVINEIRMTPSISKYKLLIIDSIDKLNINAQNVLLKTLEEPPKNTFIFLICNNIDKTIKTIISRSNIILVPPLKIESWVKAVFNKDDISSVLSFNIKKSIAEISNLDEYFISVLFSFVDELEEYISEVVSNNDYNFQESLVVRRVWKKYSKSLEEIEDNAVKKIIYFELLTITTFTDQKFNSYFKYLKNKLGISDIVCKEIDNLVYANASVYKSIRDIVEIG